MGNEIAVGVVLTAADRAAVGAFRRLRRNMAAAGEDTDKLSRKFDSMMRSFRVGAGLGAAALGLRRVIQPGVHAAAEYQEALKSLKGEMALAGPTIDTAELKAQLAEVRRMAAEYQKETSFDATGVLQIAVQLKKGGMTIEDFRRGALRSTAQMATAFADQIDPSRAGEIQSKLSAALRNRDYQGQANDLTQISGAASTNINDLYEGAVVAAGLAADFGVDRRNYLAAIATMQGKGERGTKAGEGMKALFNKLSDAWGDKKKRAILQASGVNPFDAQGHLHLPQLINQLRKSLAGKSPAEALKSMQDLFGSDHGSKILKLLSTGEGSFEDVLAKSTKSATLEQRVNIRLEGEKASLQALKGNIQTTLAEGFQPLVQTLKQGEDYLSGWVDKIREAVSASKGLRQTISYAVPAAAGVMGVGAILSLLVGAGKGGALLARIGGRGLFKSQVAHVGVELAKAKALRETGVNVTTVWVANWPASLAATGVPGMVGSGVTAPVAAASAEMATVLGSGALAIAAGIGAIVAAAAGLMWVMHKGEQKMQSWAEQEFPKAERPTSSNTGQPMTWRELMDYYGTIDAAREAHSGVTTFDDKGRRTMTPRSELPPDEAAELDAFEAGVRRMEQTGRSALTVFEKLEMWLAAHPSEIKITVDQDGRIITDERLERAILRGSM